jgi:hypothetical protein
LAKLSAFKIDSRKVEQGEWIQPGEEFEDLEILTRGFTDVYEDAKNGRLRRASVGFGGNQNKIPNAIRREIVVDCLIKHCLLDVRNLSNGDGDAITFTEFCELLRSGDYPDLVNAAIAAASQVGMRRAADVEDAVGNLETPSDASSNGANSPT